jgi:nitrous oxide reductase accessory protein NosL
MLRQPAALNKKYSKKYVWYIRRNKSMKLVRTLRTLLLSFAILFILIQVCCVRPSFAAESADAVENPKHCEVCGMDRSTFAQSRMLIEYADGIVVGVCSMHCAAAELKRHGGKEVKSLLVADYETKKLIDAKTAVWVIGGNREGVMTSLPKWAFAKEEDARKFISENGGKLASFDEAMRAAEDELKEGNEMTQMGHMHMGHDMCHMDMGPGAQMLFNPAFGDHIYHTHPARMWMVSYEFMHMGMRGLRTGTTDVSTGSVGYNRPGLPYNYMMIPTSMTMDMHMVMVMYGITDRLTVMAMPNYQINSMKMLMDMGPGRMITTEPPMTIRGFGDTELRGMYKINKWLVGSLGLSLPTGDIGKTFVTMRRTYRAPYDMQLGSGTYDLKPALTYNGFSGDEKWNWGAQAQYTWHTAKNNNGWRFGDNFKLTSWLQRAFGPATSWLRLAYNDTGRIKGQDPAIQLLLDPRMKVGAPMPDADPNNYGGQRLDGLIGVSYQKGCVSFGVEGGIPLYQDLNGLQLKTSWLLNAGLQVMF